MTYSDGQAWRAGPHRLYGRLASAAVDTVTPVAGLTAVDAGSGTGAMAQALAARGAWVICVDRSLTMLRLAPEPRLAGDIAALPLASRRFDLATASFVLSHVDDPHLALAELARVTRTGGRVLATAFPAGDRHPVKDVVDKVLHEFGYRAPDWYQHLKETGEARVGDPALLAALGRSADLKRVRVRELAVPLADLDAAAVAAWRLGMAQVAPFVTDLPALTRDELVARARSAVTPGALAAPLRMLVLTGEVGQPRWV